MRFDRLQESDLLLQETRLVVFYFFPQPPAFSIVDLRMIKAVTVQAADLPPVDVAVLAFLAVEHIRVYPTDTGTQLVYPASPVLQEVTGAIMIRPDGIA